MKTTKLSLHTEPTVFAFLETASNLVHRFDRVCSIRGISFSEYRLLSAIASSGAAGCPRIDLAQKVGLTPSAVTRALKPLEKLGYVKNKRNERDARQSLAFISSGGLQLLDEVRAVLHDELISLPLNTLSEKEIAVFKLRLLDLR